MTPDQAAFPGVFLAVIPYFCDPQWIPRYRYRPEKTILAGVAGIGLVIIALRFANPGITLQALLLIEDYSGHW